MSIKTSKIYCDHCKSPIHDFSPSPVIQGFYHYHAKCIEQMQFLEALKHRPKRCCLAMSDDLDSHQGYGWSKNPKHVGFDYLTTDDDCYNLNWLLTCMKHCPWCGKELEEDVGTNDQSPSDNLEAV